MDQLYGASPNVIYEIFNEPLPTYDWATIKTYAAGVVSSIRAYDPNNLIVIPTPSRDAQPDVAAADPLAGTNQAYTLHFYAGETSHQAPLRAKVQTASDLGLPLVSFTSLNTACWDNTGTNLPAGDVSKIDRIGVYAPSGETSITLSHLCLTGITFR